MGFFDMLIQRLPPEVQAQVQQQQAIRAQQPRVMGMRVNPEMGAAITRRWQQQHPGQTPPWQPQTQGPQGQGWQQALFNMGGQLGPSGSMPVPTPQPHAPSGYGEGTGSNSRTSTDWARRHPEDGWQPGLPTPAPGSVGTPGGPTWEEFQRQINDPGMGHLTGDIGKQPSMDGNRQTADPSTLLQPRAPQPTYGAGGIDQITGERYGTPLPTNIMPGGWVPPQTTGLGVAPDWYSDRAMAGSGTPLPTNITPGGAPYLGTPGNVQQPINGGAATGQQQDPKTAIQAILAQYPPGSAGLEAAMPQIQAMFPGTRFDSSGGPKDEIVIPGYGLVDVVTNAETGGQQGWSWQTQGSHAGAGAGPGRQASGGTLGALGGAAGGDRNAALAATPGYQFILSEAMGALEKSAASRGTLLTGGHLKELQNRAAGLASTNYQNEFQNNLSLGQLGFNAATNQGAYGTSYGNQITDLTTGAGNAQAAGTVGGANAWNSALGNIGQQGLDAWGLYHYGPPNRGYGGGIGGNPGTFPQQTGWNGK